MSRFDFYDFEFSTDLSTRKAQQKFLQGEKLSVMDKMKLGRDEVQTEFKGYKCKSDCAYRAVGEEGLMAYLKNGNVFNPGEDYEKGNGNAGVDWFLGGVGTAYAKKGCYVIECPADMRYFVSTLRAQAVDPRAQHLKSGSKNPIPLKYCKIMSVDDMEKGIYDDIKALAFPYEEMKEEPLQAEMEN